MEAFVDKYKYLEVNSFLDREPVERADGLRYSSVCLCYGKCPCSVLNTLQPLDLMARESV